MKTLLIALFAAAFIGCATTPRPTIQSMLASVGEYPDGVNYDKASEVEWQRAQIWLSKHSRWKVQTATDVMIETYNPREYSSSYGFELTREPIDANHYVIRMRAVCSNSRDNCEPEKQGMKRAFYHYVATGEDVLAGVTHFHGLR